MATLMQQKDALEALQAIATVCAVIAAGGWAFWLFVKRRGAYPNVQLCHEVEVKPIHSKGESEKYFVRVAVIVRNIGGVLLVLKHFEVRLSHVLPLSNQHKLRLKERQDFVQPNALEIDGPLLGIREMHAIDGEVEPGGSTQIIADFCMNHGVQTFEVYSRVVSNRQGPKAKWAWRLATLHDIPVASNERKP